MGIKDNLNEIFRPSEYDSPHVQEYLSNKANFRKQQIKLSNSIFICHRYAIPAFRVWSSVTISTNMNISDKKINEYRLNETPLYVIKALPNPKNKSNNNIYHFINEFELIQILLRMPNTDKISIRIIETADEVTITYWSWFEIFKLTSSGADAPVDWVKLRDLINTEMPIALREKLFDCKKLMKQQLCDLVGMTLRQYEYPQVLRKKQLEQEGPHISFSFDTIFSGEGDDK
jgi:hypothetical protein